MRPFATTYREIEKLVKRANALTPKTACRPESIRLAKRLDFLIGEITKVDAPWVCATYGKERWMSIQNTILKGGHFVDYIARCCRPGGKNACEDVSGGSRRSGPRAGRRRR